MASSLDSIQQVISSSTEELQLFPYGEFLDFATNDVAAISKVVKITHNFLEMMGKVFPQYPNLGYFSLAGRTINTAFTGMCLPRDLKSFILRTQEKKFNVYYAADSAFLVSDSADFIGDFLSGRFQRIGDTPLNPVLGATLGKVAGVFAAVGLSLLTFWKAYHQKKTGMSYREIAFDRSAVFLSLTKTLNNSGTLGTKSFLYDNDGVIKNILGMYTTFEQLRNLFRRHLKSQSTCCKTASHCTGV